LLITDESQLKGLPDGAKEAAHLTAKQKDKEGWLFTLDYPSYVPFMTYIENRELRKKMALAFGARSFKNNKFDLFIKTILRSYTGLFENFSKIDEFEIAKRMKTTKDKVVKALQYLDNLELISYLEQTTQPQLTYLTERLDIKDVKISAKHYHDRKEIAIKKMESVIYFATAKHKCRSEILLNYFGEKDIYRCGVCDVCLERNKLDLSDIEFSSVSDQVKKIVQEEQLPITDVINKITGVRDDKTIKVIQWLMENDKLISNKKNLLEWRK